MWPGRNRGGRIACRERPGRWGREKVDFIRSAIWCVILSLKDGVGHQSLIVAGVGFLLPCCASVAVLHVRTSLQGRQEITRMHAVDLPFFLPKPE